MQPTWGTVSEGVGADARDQQVGHGEEHRGDAPLQVGSAADRIEQPIGRHVAAQVVAGVAAERPGQADHGGPLVARVSPSRRQYVYERPSWAVPKDPQSRRTCLGIRCTPEPGHAEPIPSPGYTQVAGWSDA